MPKEKYLCPVCNTSILFDRRDTIVRRCSCGFSGSKKDYSLALEPAEKSFDFWPRKKSEIKEKVTGFDKNNLFDEDGKIIDPRKATIKDGVKVLTFVGDNALAHNYFDDPKKHKLDVKIATVRKGHHCKFNINYHIIWIPKYRKKILNGKVVEVLRQIIIGQCEDMQLDMLALEIMPDHLHLFVGARPTHKPCMIVKQFKGNTSIQLRRCFSDLRYLGYKQHFGKGFKNLWARGYYCGSAGHVSQEQVRRYIEEQDGKEVFEYDIYNCPLELKGQMKIGDFS